ncbi:protein phosphatase 1 regulatory subunit 3A [Arapaima gigas]
MEHAGGGGGPRPAGNACLRAVVEPGSCDWDEDDLAGRIKPRSSPLPRRKSFCSSDDSDPGPPADQSRRVSFADAFGLSLVSVKEFDAQTTATLPAVDGVDGEARSPGEYRLSCLFATPSSETELAQRVGERKVELESVELLPGSTTVQGFVQVLNLCFRKKVHVRVTLDRWRSHFDLPAEFVPASGNGRTDRFAFRLALVPPFAPEGARVEFCLRYETPHDTFWANNGGLNYVLFCRKKEEAADGRRQTEDPHSPRRSCLKVLFFFPPPKDKEVSAMTETPETQPSEASRDGEQDGTAGDRSLSCSRRSRRRAARLAQIRDHFAQRELLAAGGNVNAAADANGRETTLSCDPSPPLAWEPENEGGAALGRETGDVRCGRADEQQQDAGPDFLQGEGLLDAQETAAAAGMAAREGAALRGHLLSPGESNEAGRAEPLAGRSDVGPGGSPEPSGSEVQALSKGDTNTRSDISCDVNADLSWDPSTEGSRSTSDDEAEVPLPSDPPFTFTTFVAPLYQQAFSRVESENLYFADSDGGQEEEGQKRISHTKAVTLDRHCSSPSSLGEEGSADVLKSPVCKGGVFRNRATESTETSGEDNVGRMSAGGSAGDILTPEEPENAGRRPAEEHGAEEKEEGDTREDAKAEEGRMLGVVSTHVEEIESKDLATVMEVELNEEQREAFLKEAEGADMMSADKEASSANDREEIAQSGDALPRREDLQVFAEQKKGGTEEGEERQGKSTEEMRRRHAREEFCGDEPEAELKIRPEKSEEQRDEDALSEKEVPSHEGRETVCGREEEYNRTSGCFSPGGAAGQEDKGEYLKTDKEIREDVFRQKQEGEEDSSSSESLTDEEMEQYLLSLKTLQNICLTGREAHRGAGSPARKRPSVSRGRLSPTALSSITESLDEDRDAEEEGQAASPCGGPVERGGDAPQWRDALTCGDPPQTLLCALLFLTALYYDEFLACCALYLLSVYWLCCHGEEDGNQSPM